MKLYSVDSVNGRVLLAGEGDAGRQAWIQRQFFEFVRHEVVPAIRADCSSDDIEIIAAGASIGAFNAVGVRVPVTPTCSAPPSCMSGTYDLRRFFDGPVGDDYCGTAPLAVPAAASTSTHLELLRQRFVVLASGEGANEDIGESWRMAARARRRGRAQPGRSRGGRSGRTTGRCGGRCCRGYLDESGREALDRSARGPTDRQGNTTDRRTAIRWMLRDLQALERMLAGRHVRDRRAPHRGRAGDVPRRRARGSRRPVRWRCSPTSPTASLHDRGRRVQPRAQPRPAGASAATASSRMEAQLDPLLDRSAAPSPRPPGSTSCSPASCRPSARRDLSLDNMVAEPALPGPQRRRSRACAARPTSCTSRGSTSFACARTR